MLSAAVCRSRLSVVIVCACVASVLLLLFTFSESFSAVSWDYAHKAQDYWKSSSDKLASSSPSVSTKVYDCEDPYRRPGYLYIDESDYKKTRWIPFTTDFLDAPVPDYAQYPVPEGKDIFFNVTEVDTDFLNAKYTPRDWMPTAVAENKRRRDAVSVEGSKAKASDFAGMKDDGGLGWLWGRRVLIMGDSVDRFMIQFFCEEFGSVMRQPKIGHSTATCAIPAMNVTLVHWHFAGSWSYHPDWWWMDDMKDISFETRWESIWRPTLDAVVRGPSGQPDLLLWQNGLWDQRALWEAAEAHFDLEHPLGVRERKLAWQEIRFVAARLKKFVQQVHSEFPNVPTMFRAITVHQESNAEDANIYELDRLSRAIAEQAGHESFEWARLIAANSMLYKDRTHPGKGAGSWLWGNMVLEYLARGAGEGDAARSPYFDGWDACHEHLTAWGGR